MNISAKVKDRFSTGLKKYKPIVAKAQAQDVNESDTVSIITDILSDIFGYDKYSEITSEYAIKKTFCDLAVEIDKKPKLLIEAKAAGMTLKENHIKQATDYGANSGIEWIVLTNSVDWQIYRIIFDKPVSHELIYSFKLTDLNPRKESDLELLLLISKETIKKDKKSALEEYSAQKQLLNGGMIGQILMSDDVLGMVRRIVKKISPDTKVTKEEILEVLKDDVIKREILEDDKASTYKKQINKVQK